MSWETLQSDEVFASPFVVVHRDKVELPDGVQIDDFYTVTVSDAAMIVALTEDNSLLLKSEYRYSCGEELIECPAGTFDKNETDPLQVAKRELLEETGYISEDWTYLGATRESTSKLTNTMHLFLAKDCIKACEQHLDKTEHMDLIIIPLEKADGVEKRNPLQQFSSWDSKSCKNDWSLIWITE